MCTVPTTWQVCTDPDISKITSVQNWGLYCVMSLAGNDEASRTKEKNLSALPSASASTLVERTCLKDTYVNQA